MRAFAVEAVQPADDPPFDGKPCPMCPLGIRSIAASVHNLLVRWPDRNYGEQLHDLNIADPSKLSSDDPQVTELLAAASEVVTGLRGANGFRGPWLLPLLPRLRAAAIAIEKLSDAHFADARHAHNKLNVLRSQRGYTSSLDGTGYDYDYTVEAVPPSQGHMAHRTCGSGLKLHEYFRKIIAADPTFYGLIWCPTCVKLLPAKEFS